MSSHEIYHTPAGLLNGHKITTYILFQFATSQKAKLLSEYKGDIQQISLATK